MDIGQKIKAARKASGFTQDQLAQKSGVATITIRQYEAGKRQPRLEQLGKIAKALNTTTFDLAGPEWGQIDMGGVIDFDEGHKDRLKKAFEQLNNIGKSVAVERVEELTKISDYRKDKK